MMNLTETIKQFALESAGFDLVGVTRAELPERYGQALDAWIAEGHAGSMDYMKKDPTRRSQPTRVLPGAKSVISLALNYYHPEDPKPQISSPGKVAKYAYGRDYHTLIQKKLKKLARFIEATGGEGTQTKIYVDTGPVLEKAIAREAGIGFFGKNTNIISRDYGSWIFLASILTNLDLEMDTPHAGACGTCRICIDACPTGALLGNTTLDATRCISYLTIESQEPIPKDLKAGVGEWVFGCDVCQDVCPYNFRAKTTKHEELYPSKMAGTWFDLEKAQILPGSPLKRAKKLRPKG